VCANRSANSARPRERPFGEPKPSPGFAEPKQPSLACRAEAAFASVAEPKIGPPSRLRRYGATAFACIHKRRLVSLNFASWNQIATWLRQLDNLRTAA